MLEFRAKRGGLLGADEARAKAAKQDGAPEARNSLAASPDAALLVHDRPLIERVFPLRT